MLFQFFYVNISYLRLCCLQFLCCYHQRYLSANCFYTIFCVWLNNRDLISLFLYLVFEKYN